MKMIVHDVGKSIRGIDVLQRASLTLGPGKVLGLSGPNGSGKTMLMRIVSGLVRPTTGSVSIDGKVLGKDLSFPPSMGALIEGPSFLDNRTGLANLMLIASIRERVDEKRMRRTLEEVGLDPDDPRRYRAYSLGMKQRLGIAAAIMEEPDIIVLDEPTNALDASGVKMVARLIRRERDRGGSIILTCHDSEVLHSLADEIICLAEGHIDGVEIKKGQTWHKA